MRPRHSCRNCGYYSKSLKCPPIKVQIFLNFSPLRLRGDRPPNFLTSASWGQTPPAIEGRRGAPSHALWKAYDSPLNYTTRRHPKLKGYRLASHVSAFRSRNSPKTRLQPMADPAGLSAAVLVAKLCGQNVPVMTMGIIPNSEVSVSLVLRFKFS